MTTFRHLDYDAAADVQQLGPAALDDLLDRGDVRDWGPLLRRVAQDPHGPLAERILALCTDHALYGTSRLWRAWIERRREEGPLPDRTPDVDGLRDLRRRRGLTQAQVGHRLGISQSDVSKLERRSDARLSTLARFIEATGGRLHLEVAYGDERVRLTGLTGPAD